MLAGHVCVCEKAEVKIRKLRPHNQHFINCQLKQLGKLFSISGYISPVEYDQVVSRFQVSGDGSRLIRNQASATLPNLILFDGCLNTYSFATGGDLTAQLRDIRRLWEWDA